MTDVVLQVQFKKKKKKEYCIYYLLELHLVLTSSTPQTHLQVYNYNIMLCIDVKVKPE